MKAAAPFPRIGVMRVAGADRERASMHVAVIDVPAFVSSFRIAASGEFGHALLKRGVRHQAIAPAVGLGSADSYWLSCRLDEMFMLDFLVGTWGVGEQ